MNTGFKILHAIIFQIGWFICILTSNTTSLVFTLLFIAFHFLAIYLLSKTLSLKTEIAWLITGLIIGLICETIFFSSGILQQTTSDINSNWLILPPLWLLCLWLLFVASIRTSLTFVVNRPLLASAMALVVAPLNYYAGANLHSQIEIGQPLLLNLIALALLWTLALRCLIATHSLYFEDNGHA